MRKESLLLVLIAVGMLSFTFFESKSEKNISFEEWKSTFDVEFESSEEEYRRLIFLRNLKIINHHNADNTQTYKMGINQFTVYS